MPVEQRTMQNRINTENCSARVWPATRLVSESDEDGTPGRPSNRMLLLFMKESAQQRAVYLQLTVVLDQAQSPKPVHEVAHARLRAPDHRRERVLVDPGGDWLRPSLRAGA